MLRVLAGGSIGLGALGVVSALAAGSIGGGGGATVAGVAAGGALSGLGVVLAGLSVRLRWLSALSDALDAYATGERETPALEVATRFGPRAAAWNAILTERQDAEDAALSRAGLAVAAGDARQGGSFLQTFDAMWHGLLVIDEQLLVLHANGAAAVMLGRERGQLEGADFAEVVGASELVEAARGVASGRSSRQVVTADRRQNGQRSVLRASIRPVRREDRAAALVVVEDVTQQHVAEEARNAFVAQATHELRTPLTNIRLYVEEAIEDGEHDPVLRARALEVIQTEARRLERVVADMLSVSEIQAGTLTLRPGEVNLAQVFEELAADFRPQAESKAQAFRVSLPPKFPRAHADRDKLTLALHNVVGNAIKYTPEGGSVTVTVEADERELTVEVRDTGMGILPEDREKVFDRFYRASGGRVDHVTGTGLGLALARDVVRLHGGDIALESEVDKGSTFTVRVPIVAANAARAA